MTAHQTPRDNGALIGHGKPDDRKAAIKWCRFLVALFFLSWFGAIPSPASAGVRLALLLGNAKYEAVPALDNPSNDAADLAQALRNVGFEVIEQRDATRDVMAKAVHDFAERLRGADTALFFYAGHGLQMNGENYLLPVDAKIESAADVRFNTINLSDIQQEMEGTGRANIIILDACRNNPFADKLAHGGRGVTTRGLGRIDASGEGSLIVYSTQPNNVALDGAGRNSPFTAALLKHVATPGLEVRQMISKVRGDVLDATDHRQTPWDSSSLVGDVYLAGPPAAGIATNTPPMPTPAPANNAVASVIAPATAPPAPAQDRAGVVPDIVRECDRLTMPPDPTVGSPVVGVKTDWNRAIVACEAAVKAEPGEPHFHFALGKAYFYAKNYFEAARHLTVAADTLPEAQNALGVCFALGLGVAKNEQRAFELYTKAAAAGSAIAMESLGGSYISGTYVKQDFGKAMDWMEKSVEAGNADALQQIGNMYFNGQGVPKDYTMAAQYFQQAADLNNGYALRFLANMYEVGLVGPPNPEKAGALRLKAEQVDPDGARQPEPVSFFRRVVAANQSHRQERSAGPTRRYVVYRRIRFGGCNWMWC
jgi:tetratricopeptide (TPR) repeat protein